jgi:hypothetical protein
MSMFDTAMRAEIALGRGDVDTGLHLWRTVAATLRDTQRPEPGSDLSRLDPWALQVQAVAVVAHAHHGRLGLVAEITGALPAVSAYAGLDPEGLRAAARAALRERARVSG